MQISNRDLVRIASTDPYLYTLIDVNNPTSIDINDPASKELFRTIAVTSVLITDHNDTDPNIVRFVTERLCDTSFLKQESLEEKDLKLAGHPSVLFGKSCDPGLFHEESIGHYQKICLGKEGYWHYILKLWLFPLFLTLIFIIVAVFFICVVRKPFKFMRNSIWISFIIYVGCIYILITFGSYICIYWFESGVGNPDIMGKPADLLKVFLLYFKSGDVACLTNGGKVVRGLTVLAGALCGIGLVARAGVSSAEEKIREVLKMAPVNSKKHVVILNWTQKTEEVIQNLREAIDEKTRLIIFGGPDEQNQQDKQTGDMKYNPDINVITIYDDPSEIEILNMKEVGITCAKTILILGDEKHQNESNIRVLNTLISLKSIMKKVKNKPRIIVGLPNAEPKYEKRMKEEGADRIIAYFSIKHKLLAQAVVTPDAVNFVNEILTVDKESNEVYILEIEDFYKEAGTFQEFASKIANACKKRNKPITVIGVKSREGKLFFNPKYADFSKIQRSHKIDAAIVLAREKPNKLKKRKSRSQV